MLARAPSEITIGDILYAQEGEIALVDCVANGDICYHESICPSRDIWMEASRLLSDYFYSLTLEDVLKDWGKKNNNNKRKKAKKK